LIDLNLNFTKSHKGDYAIRNPQSKLQIAKQIRNPQSKLQIAKQTTNRKE
jgi:hypothetical protein